MRSEMVNIVVEAEVKPTEDVDKVLKAITTIIDPESIETVNLGKSTVIVAKSKNIVSLAKLHRLLRLERILDTARSIMRQGVQENKTVFYIHKQASYMGKVSFVSGDHESPLGAIKVIIESSNIYNVIDCLAPQTSKGRLLRDYSIYECREA
ncbi:MAG: RNA-binding domain-containing protein [Acidilobaceae archaeon]